MTHGAQATAFFGRTYGEAMTLLVEARDYLAHREPIDRHAVAPNARLLLSCEATRLTARLTHVMAWLLAQRAVYEGEIDQAAALKGHHALTDLAICMEGGGEQAGELPPRFSSLLDRSRRLYIRVARLDELARRQLD